MAKSPHIILFPFMSKGHTIPLLHLAKLIHNHHLPQATFTIFTTPANESFISLSLSSSLPPNVINIISLPFPSSGRHDLPPGVESTDKLPSMSLLPDFYNVIEQLQPAFETALEELRNNDVLCLISDGFLHWTQQSASKFNIPRLFFYGMNCYAQIISRLTMEHRTLWEQKDDDELFQIPDFPWIKVTKNDFESSLTGRDPKNPTSEFIFKCVVSASKSHGQLVNSFYELESKFLDHYNSKYDKFKLWPIGPLCLANKPNFERLKKQAWIGWLDRQTKPILYVAFGSQAEISNEQLKEIMDGLEKSRVSFFWALRLRPNHQKDVIEGFEERVKERGLVVKEWVDQREILEHGNVGGFLSHSGWNSVMESICAGVPILAWPMMAEQHLNARMVVEEIEIGLRVETCDGSVRGFVKSESLSKMVKELMMGDQSGTTLIRTRVKELSEIANKVVEKGGSSWKNLQVLLDKLEDIASSSEN